jgi:TolB protein
VLLRARSLVVAALASALVATVVAVAAGPAGTAGASPSPTALLLSFSQANYRMDPGTGAITTTPIVGNDAVLSPKGDRVAFTRDVDPCVPDPDTTCRATFDLLTAKPDGTGEQLVLSGGTETSFIAPDWSPDGKQITVTATSDPGGALRGIVVINADGTGLRSLDRLGFDGTFSPDGKHIAYTRSGELWVLDVASDATRMLTSGAEATGVPDWSPDGKRIVFTSLSDVLSVSAKGGTPTGLIKVGTSFSIRFPRTPVYSPDGTRVAFAATLSDPNDPLATSFPAVLSLSLDLGDPAVVAQQAGDLTDWIRTG